MLFCKCCLGTNLFLGKIYIIFLCITDHGHSHGGHGHSHGLGLPEEKHGHGHSHAVEKDHGHAHESQAKISQEQIMHGKYFQHLICTITL